MKARRVLLYALWFGLATGTSIVALLTVKKFALDRHIRFGPDLMWMAPLADAVLFVLVALLLLIVARQWTALRSFGVVVGVFTGLGALSAFHLYYPLHPIARVLLAVGIGVQGGRLLRRWEHSVDRLIRRTAPWAFGAVVVLAIAVRASEAVSFRQHLAALPPAPAGAPNVLLIVLDTVRAQNLSLHGYSRATTPNLERWARTSVVFENAISTAPWTLPSHATMLTGRWPHEQSSSLTTPMDGRHRTLADVLSRSGYATAGFVANTFFCGYEFGLSRGFGHYEDYVPNARELVITSTLTRSLLNAKHTRRLLGYYDNLPRRTAPALTDQFLSWLPQAGSRPFFAFLNYFDAHETYLPPPPFTELFGPDLPRSNHLLDQDLRRSLRDDWHRRPASEIQTEIDMYDGAIAYLDHHLNRLFEALADRGILDNTIVVVTSDHGELFGEHGLFLHGQALYKPLLHVPLMIRFPTRVASGVRVTSGVSVRDLAATIIDLTGVAAADLPGHSLAKLWSDVTAPPRGLSPLLSEVQGADWNKDWYPIARGDMYSLMDDTFHYIRNGDGREELYARGPDARHDVDLAGSEGGQAVLARFRAELARLVRAEPWPQASR